MTRAKMSAFFLDADVSGDTPGPETSPSFLQYCDSEHTLFQYIITIARQWDTSPEFFSRLAKGLKKKEKTTASMQALCASFGSEADVAEEKTASYTCSFEECPPGEFDAAQFFSREDNPWLSLTVAELLPEDISAQQGQGIERSGRYASSYTLSGKTSLVRAKAPRYRVVLLLAALVVAMLAGFYTGWLPEKLLLFSRYSSEKAVYVIPAPDNSLRKNATLIPDTAPESFPSGILGK